MQKTLIYSLLAISLVSCATNTGTGALVGGGGGALVGGLAGGWGGAAIGGAAGAILGGLIGNAADQKEKERNQQQIDSQYPGLSQKLMNNEPLNTQDVISLSKQNIPPQQIIAYLKESRSQFSLSKQDCKTLCRKGVDDSVVRYMSKGACGFPES